MEEFSLEVAFKATDYEKIRLTVEDVARPGPIPLLPHSRQFTPVVTHDFTPIISENQYIFVGFESLYEMQKNLDFGENQERTERT